MEEGGQSFKHLQWGRRGEGGVRRSASVATLLKVFDARHDSRPEI